MTFLKKLKTLIPVGALVMACALPTLAAEVGGVKFDDTATVGGKSLVLNGLGMRQIIIVKVYAAALYVTEKKTSSADVQALTTPKRVALNMQREVNSDEFGQLFITSMNKNSTKEEKAKVVNQTVKFGEMFASMEKVKKGDVITLDWIPGTGTVLTVKGKAQGEPFKEPEFFNALLRIWLGPNPADWKLKDALLGK